jgi:hypothetical protein
MQLLNTLLFYRANLRASLTARPLYELGFKLATADVAGLYSQQQASLLSLLLYSAHLGNELTQAHYSSFIEGNKYKIYLGTTYHISFY